MPLRVATVALSSVAGLMGLVVFVVLGQKGRTRDAWMVGSLAASAGFPAFVILLYVIYPNWPS
jgi:hypothetical protein